MYPNTVECSCARSVDTSRDLYNSWKDLGGGQTCSSLSIKNPSCVNCYCMFTVIVYGYVTSSNWLTWRWQTGRKEPIQTLHLRSQIWIAEIASSWTGLHLVHQQSKEGGIFCRRKNQEEIMLLFFWKCVLRGQSLFIWLLLCNDTSTYTSLIKVEVCHHF